MAAVPDVAATAVVAAGAATRPIAYQRRRAMDGTVVPSICSPVIGYSETIERNQCYNHSKQSAPFQHNISKNHCFNECEAIDEAVHRKRDS